MSFCKGMGSVVLAVSKTLYFSNPIPNDRRECGVGVTAMPALAGVLKTHYNLGKWDVREKFVIC